MRATFEIQKDEIIIGMIARFQEYRRTEVVLEALKLIIKEFPKVKLLLVGRSSKMNESVNKPMKKLAIEPWVILGGCRTDGYIDTLA
jgi:glycosyltransferase involved in cell wall biosynthesis